MHVVDVVMHPAEGGTDDTTYTDPSTTTEDQDTVADLFMDAALATDGEVGSSPATTFVSATGPTPSAFAPTTEIVYVVPLTRPDNEHVVPPTVVHDADPGDAVAVYVAPTTLPCHETKAPLSDGAAESCRTWEGAEGTYKSLLGVCVERPEL